MNILIKTIPAPNDLYFAFPAQSLLQVGTSLFLLMFNTWIQIYKAPIMRIYADPDPKLCQCS